MLRKSKMKRRNTEPVLTASIDRPGLPPDKASISEKPEGPEWWIIEAEGEENKRWQPLLLRCITKQQIRQIRNIYTGNLEMPAYTDTWKHKHKHTHKSSHPTRVACSLLGDSIFFQMRFFFFYRTTTTFQGTQTSLTEIFCFPITHGFLPDSFSHSWY